nr:carbohydrate porin [Bradyrhizobium canariense]
MPTPAWSSSGSATKRHDDKLGIAFGYAHISKRVQQLDSDYRTFVASTDYNARS